MVQCPEKGPGTEKVLMLKTEDWSFLRRLHLQEGKSIRWIADNFRMSRKTVAKYVKEQTPPKYLMTKPRACPSLGQYKAQILAILEADKKAPTKHKHTSKRIYDRLVAEHGYTGGQSTVRNYVMHLKNATAAPKLFIPLDFPPGDRAQVDFGEVHVCLGCPMAHLPLLLRNDACRQKLVKVQCFVMRLCYSRRIFAMCFPSANIPAFIAAHRLAFEYFASRPETLVYDNLSLAVKKVLNGRDRELTDSFERLTGYYGFGFHFCQPGKDGAHEKGGVESGIGFVRRNWCVPVLHVQSIQELNEYLLQKCEEDRSRLVDGQACTIAEAWEMEQPYMTKLPARGIDTCTVEPAALDSYGMVRFDKNFYSLPEIARIGSLWVKAHWDRIEITDGTKCIASHKRSYRTKERIFAPEHYFDVLEQRPGAVPYARPILAHPWPDLYWQFYDRLKRAHGLSQAGKEFVRVLRLHNQYGEDATTAALQQIMERGTLNANLVQSLLVYGKRSADEFSPLDLTDRSHLADYEVLAVDLAQYQQLTGGDENDREPAA